MISIIANQECLAKEKYVTPVEKCFMSSREEQVEALERQGFVCRVEGDEVVCTNEQSITVSSMEIKANTTIRLPRDKIKV